MNSFFFNISNHPSSKWGEGQLRAAKALGYDIVDIPFPNVNPNASTEDIWDMAQSLKSQIMSYFKGQEYKDLIEGNISPVVHIMGEMTLTHSVVNLLQEEGFTCVASCSERSVKEVTQEDGSVKKVSIFNFVQFRPYAQW